MLRGIMTKLKQTLCSAALVLAGLAAVGCNDDKPAKSAQSSGGETPYQRVKRSADEAHSNFKQEIKPQATWVDEKSNRAASELRKGVGAEPRNAEDQD
jgi:hypothetical protein